jgi:hypothetical protein
MGLFNLLAAVAKMCSSTSRLLSGPGCVRSTRDKPSSTRLRTIEAKSPRPILGSSSGISVLSNRYADWRCRRRRSISSTTAWSVGCRSRCGRDERSIRPASPSARKRSTHLRTVLTQTPKAVATAFGVCLSINTRRTNSVRLRGVRRAFLWISIRSPRITEASATSASSIRTKWTT